MQKRINKVLLSLLLTYVFILMNHSESFSQDVRAITGTVYDAKTNNALQDVSVKVKNGTAATVTDGNGAFYIRVKNSDVLELTHVGYQDAEVKVGTQTNITVNLNLIVGSLEEVLVVGYGSQKRKDLTGAVGSVNMNDLTKAPVASFDQALAGRIAGVQVSSAEDGQPGQGMNIVIRGSNSLTQDNSPLYVIDGFPMEDPETAGINPDDIESISVLKDASATAIYGSRAANGVIVIETKKGEAGPPGCCCKLISWPPDDF